MKKKILALLLILSILFSAVPAFALGSEPTLVAESALLMDMNTGTVLYEKDADSKRYPASMTKMMTCILALENMDLSKYITVNGADIKGIVGDKVGLYAGEEMNVGTMISAMMVISGNDAAVVLAKEMAGSVEAFADMMNAKAAQLGMTDTHFVNPNGQNDDNQYTTARDMAKLAIYCMQNEVFRRIVARPEFTVPVTNKTSERYFKNTNALLLDGKYHYDGCIGIKTGTTTPAGGCLTSAVTRGDTTLLAVVMKSSNEERFSDSIALFDYGFANYKTVSIGDPESIPETVSVKGGKEKTVAISVPTYDKLVTVSSEVQSSALEAKIAITEPLQAPIKAGDVVGELQIVDGENIVDKYDITAASDVEAKGRLVPDFDFGGGLFKKILLIIGIVFVSLIILIAVYVIVQRKKTEKRKAARAARRAQIEEQEMQLRKEWEKTYHGHYKDEL